MAKTQQQQQQQNQQKKQNENQNMSSWAQKELIDHASTTFRGRLFQSLIVLGKNEYTCKW